MIGCINAPTQPAASLDAPSVELDSLSVITEYHPPYPIHVHYLSEPHEVIAEAVRRAVRRWGEVLAPTPLEPLVFAKDTGCIGLLLWRRGEVLAPGLHLYIEPTDARGHAGVSYQCYGTQHPSQETYAAGVIGLDGPNPGYDGWTAAVREKAVEGWFAVATHEIAHIVITGDIAGEQRCDSAGSCRYLYWSKAPAVMDALDRLLEGTFPGKGAPADRFGHWAACIAWTGRWKPNTCKAGTVGASGCHRKNKVWDVMATVESGTAITEITLGALHSGYRHSPASADPYIANFEPNGLAESTVFRGHEYWKQCPEFADP